MNRRSYRISKKQKSTDEDDYDLTKVAFLVLFKILRKFREVCKNELSNLSSLNSLDSPAISHRSSNSKNTSTNKNKRKVKEESKKQELNKDAEHTDSHIKFETKYSNPQDKGLVPSTYKSLFSNMEKGEEYDNTPTKGFRIDEFLSNSNTKSLQNAKQSARTIPGFTLKDELINKEKSVSKSSDEMKQNKSKISGEMSSKHGSNHNLSANVSPSKKLNYEGDRDHSINSNLSHSFGYNNEDFNPFGNKNNNNMNLSKPQEFNYDTNMNPSISFMGSMINKHSG
jgi:hypothetical protein